MRDNASIDWPARKVGGLIDFRLPSDPEVIPIDVLDKRRTVYLQQLRARTAAEKQTRAARYKPNNWIDYFGELDT